MRLFRVVAVLAALMSLGGPLSAAEYPASGGNLTVSDKSVDGGDEVVLSGGGFAPGAEVVVTIGSEPLELAKANANAEGNITVSVTLPESFADGSHTLKATGPAAIGGTLVLSSVIEVGGTLPFTGLEWELWIVVAAGLGTIAAGTLVNRLIRR